MSIFLVKSITNLLYKTGKATLINFVAISSNISSFVEKQVSIVLPGPTLLQRTHDFEELDFRSDVIFSTSSTQ